ncbi:AraC family transcriptional regulator [Paenibacillus psychroresistens]|uniref:AraC family transcriptional regulator n=1 Tax=Paenibacillus psychroresistens TaxID=1778678 RepID=A0A6B8RH19_9BACL|nr:AraC family transcriptional regulator [Paenibacillus psychroresistens]QGQ95024.1 AraC family transcriptional regulator [Paenibacillus psychroresistens]
MYESRFLAQPSFDRLPGYPIAIGRIFDEPSHLIKGKRYPFHTYNFHFIVKGRGWLKTSTEMLILESGTGFLYSGDQAQNYGSDPDDPWEVWWIYFSGKGMREILGDKALDGDAWLFLYKDNEPLLAIIQELWELSGIQDSLLIPKLAALLYEITLHLLLYGSSLRTSKKRSMEQLIKSMAEYIRLNCSKRLTLSYLAEQSGISSFYFSRMFHEYIGLPPLEYLNLQRIELAKQMLLATSKPVKLIALEVGFSQSSYFIERFRLLQGVTPAVFREQYKYPD